MRGIDPYEAQTVLFPEAYGTLSGAFSDPKAPPLGIESMKSLSGIFSSRQGSARGVHMGAAPVPPPSVPPQHPSRPPPLPAFFSPCFPDRGCKHLASVCLPPSHPGGAKLTSAAQLQLPGTTTCLNAAPFR